MLRTQACLSSGLSPSAPWQGPSWGSLQPGPGGTGSLDCCFLCSAHGSLILVTGSCRTHTEGFLCPPSFRLTLWAGDSASADNRTALLFRARRGVWGEGLVTHEDQGCCHFPPGGSLPSPCPFMLLSSSPPPPTLGEEGYIPHERVSLRVGHKQESSI